jgi:hypothetical protein
VPKLLFPASFTRVGAQKVDPTLLPAPWTICGEALITLQVKVRVVAYVISINLKREKLLSDFFFSCRVVWVRVGLSSPRLASLRTDQAGMAAIPRVPATRNNNHRGAPHMTKTSMAMGVSYYRSQPRAYLLFTTQRNRVGTLVPIHQRGPKIQYIYERSLIMSEFKSCLDGQVVTVPGMTISNGN